MQIHKSIRDVDAAERYGVWIESYSSGADSYDGTITQIIRKASDDEEGKDLSTYATYRSDTSSFISYDGSVENSSYSSKGESYYSINLYEDEEDNTYRNSQGGPYTEKGGSSYFDTSSKYSNDRMDDQGYSDDDTYTAVGNKTYVTTESTNAYVSSVTSNLADGGEGGYSFSYWSTSTGSDLSTTISTNASQTKTSTLTSYWDTVFSFLTRATTLGTETAESSQTYSYNRITNDQSQGPHTVTVHDFGGDDYLIDTIIFNNANMGGSSYLNGGACYTLSAAVGLNTTVTGKLTDLFGLNTSPMVTFSDNQVFQTSERADLLHEVFQSKGTSRFVDDDFQGDVQFNIIDGTSITATGSAASIYTTQWTTDYKIKGVGSKLLEDGGGYTIYTMTEHETGYSFPEGKAPFYTSKTQTTYAPDGLIGIGTRYFYQTRTYSSASTITFPSSTTRTHLVNSYVSTSSGTNTGIYIVGNILKTSTSTYLTTKSVARTIYTPFTVLNKYLTKTNYFVTDSDNPNYDYGGTENSGRTEGVSKTYKSNQRMEVSQIAPSPPFQDCAVFYSCPAIGYAGAGNTFTDTSVKVAKYAVVKMINGKTFKSDDVLSTVHLPTALILDHVTFFPDTIPPWWTDKPENAISMSYLTSVAKMGGKASIKVWWSASTQTTTTILETVANGDASKKTTNTTTATVAEATYALSTSESIAGKFISSYVIPIFGSYGSPFKTGYVDIRKENMPERVTMLFSLGCLDLTYQITGSDGALEAGTFSTSGSEEFVSFIVTNTNPFNFLLQPIYSFARTSNTFANNYPNIISTFKYIPPASYY